VAGTCVAELDDCEDRAAAALRLDLEGADEAVIETTLVRVGSRAGGVLDLHGRPPETDRRFRRVMILARALGWRVILRSDLVTIARHGLWDLPELLAQHAVDLVGALPSGPCADGGGSAVGDAALEVLRRLTEAGYGPQRDGARLELVAVCPAAPESVWKDALGSRGVRFDRLHFVPDTGRAHGVIARLQAIAAAADLGCVVGGPSAPCTCEQPRSPRRAGV